MRQTRKYLTAIGLVILLGSSVSGADVYRKEAQKGWWWYEDPPPVRQEEKPQHPALPAFTPEQLWTMDADQLREYAEEIKKEAVRLPSEENVRRHYVVQDVIRRKAVAFANASEVVWQKHPELSVAKDSPLAAPGRKAVTREKVEERERVLANSRERFALLYFRSEGCSFCQEQEGILGYFRERFGWTIKPIDVDARPDLASRFGIQTTPALFLIQRGSNEFIPVTAGVASASEIETKLYRGIRLLRGEVSPENFNLYDFQKGGGFDVETGR
ncbi:MAG: conjugal transfer protein TraF [Desulfuromonadales bacterium]|nr:conjugal transfer protein TraF [Desulfuromonadales bacterium]